MANLESKRSHRPAVDPVGARALAVILAFTAANALFNIVAAQLGFAFSYTSFLMPSVDRFGDFFKVILSYPGGGGVRPSDMLGLHDLLAGYITHNIYHGAAGLPTYALTHFHLPPLTTLLSLTAVWLMHDIDPVVLFLVLAGALLLYLTRIALLIGGTWRKGAIWALLGLSNYPMLLVMARGNLFAGVCALMIVHALVLAIRGRAPLLAGLLLALAMNIRPNAALFAIPMFLLYPARYRWPLACALLSAVAIGALSLLLDQQLYPDYDFAHFRRGVEIYYCWYVLDNGGLPYGSSLYGGAKLLLGYHSYMDSVCAAVAALLGLAAMIAHMLGRLDRPTFLFLMCAVYCLGSAVFGDYHLLVFLIVPIAQAMGATARDTRSSILSLPFLVSCIMLSPKNYLFIHGISFQVLLNPLLLLFATMVVILSAFRASSAPRSHAGSDPRFAF